MFKKCAFAFISWVLVLGFPLIVEANPSLPSGIERIQALHQDGDPADVPAALIEIAVRHGRGVARDEALIALYKAYGISFAEGRVNVMLLDGELTPYTVLYLLRILESKRALEVLGYKREDASTLSGVAIYAYRAHAYEFDFVELEEREKRHPDFSWNLRAQMEERLSSDFEYFIKSFAADLDRAPGPALIQEILVLKRLRAILPSNLFEKVGQAALDLLEERSGISAVLARMEEQLMRAPRGHESAYYSAKKSLELLRMKHPLVTDFLLRVARNRKMDPVFRKTALQTLYPQQSNCEGTVQ